jgi:hypothetical protein
VAPHKAAPIESEETDMKTVVPVLALTIALGSTVFAQEKAQPTPPQDKPAAAARSSDSNRVNVPLKVQIVLARFKGDKKIGSLPYTLSLTSNGRTNLRMGVEVPVTSQGGGYNYRSIGTNIDCIARAATGDSYELNITVEDSSVHLDTKPAEPGNTAVAHDAPAFRTFKSVFTVVIRDGQTGQYTSAVDPISGEVMKIDVTLNVVK